MMMMMAEMPMTMTSTFRYLLLSAMLMPDIDDSVAHGFNTKACRSTTASQVSF
jgi:hypothetical protein